MFIDKYVGKARVIVDHSEKKDHKILEIVKPKLRELNPSSFTPNDFRLPDTVNNHMFYQYEILGTIYIYVENNDLQKLVLQLHVVDAPLVEDDGTERHDSRCDGIVRRQGARPWIWDREDVQGEDRVLYQDSCSPLMIFLYRYCILYSVTVVELVVFIISVNC